MAPLIANLNDVFGVGALRPLEGPTGPAGQESEPGEGAGEELIANVNEGDTDAPSPEYQGANGDGDDRTDG